MTNAINHYLDGMISWGDLGRAEQIYVWINMPASCPAGAAANFMSE